ncbi:MAG: NAD-dependent epimerase/dehydratase family protein [Planctomycetota bacterium]
MTGGAGFIGSHLSRWLIDSGADVRVIDDLSNADAETVDRLVERRSGACRFILGSILEPEALREAIEGADVVFHLAALGSVPRSIEDPGRTTDVNTLGTFRVVETARRCGVRRLVYAASSSVYGDSPEQPKVETMPARPMSPYGASKAAGELLVRAWSTSYGLDGVSLRFFNVFGPGQRADDPYAAVIPRFIEALLRGDRPTIYGDGTQSRDFCFIDNTVLAVLLGGSVQRRLNGEAINVGCGGRTSVLDLARTLARLAEHEGIEPEFASARTGDVPHSSADIAKARELLGYEPLVTIEEGLRATLDHFKGDGEACWSESRGEHAGG